MYNNHEIMKLLHRRRALRTPLCDTVSQSRVSQVLNSEFTENAQDPVKKWLNISILTYLDVSVLGCLLLNE